MQLQQQRHQLSCYKTKPVDPGRPAAETMMNGHQSATTMVGCLHGRGPGTLNDGPRVIIASSRTTVTTSKDPFTCTCHLFQQGPSDHQTSMAPASQRMRPVARPAPGLHWSSSESTLPGGGLGDAGVTAEVVRQQRWLQHHHHHYHHSLSHHHQHRPIPVGMTKAMMDEELLRRQGSMMDRASSVSDSQLDCTCCCEWIGRVLLCSCQLPSSSDEANSPSHHLAKNGATSNNNGMFSK